MPHLKDINSTLDDGKSDKSNIIPVFFELKTEGDETFEETSKTNDD